MKGRTNTGLTIHYYLKARGNAALARKLFIHFTRPPKTLCRSERNKQPETPKESQVSHNLQRQSSAIWFHIYTRNMKNNACLRSRML